MSPFRRPIAIAALLATVLTTAACSSPSPSSSSDAAACAPSKGKVTLNYWTWLPGADKAVAAFNETHPNIQVKLNSIVSASAYQTYFNALKAKNQPDLAMIEYDHIPNFRASNYLQDISSCKPIANLKSSVVPWTYNQVTLGTDSVYATPTDTGPLALYYRRDIFKKYGLTIPTTWAEYAADAAKLKSVAPGIAMTSFTPQDAVVLQGLGWQAGAKPYTYTKNDFVIDLNSDKMNEVSDYVQGLLDKKLVNTSLQPFSPALYSAWSKGTIATTIGASWLYQIMEANAGGSSGKWGVAPLPSWTAGVESGANWGGASTAVLAGTKHPYEAAVFADWLSTDPTANKIIFGGGGTSASLAWNKTGANDQPVKFFDGQKAFQVFEAAAEKTDTSFQWAPDQTNLNNYIQDSLAGAVAGTSTVKQALAEAQAKAVTDLKGQSIPVVSK